MVIFLGNTLLDSISTFYNHPSYDTIRGYANQEKKELLYVYDEAIRELPPHSHILDLGCGNALAVHRLLKNQSYEYEGVDFSYRQIEYAQQKNPGHRYLLADFLKFSFRNNYYDLIFLRNVWHQIPSSEKEQLLMRCFSFLKPNGQLLIGQSRTPDASEPSCGEVSSIESVLSLLRNPMWNIPLTKQESKANAWVVLVETTRKEEFDVTT